MQQEVLTSQDQQYILKALHMGLQSIKVYKGEDRLNYYTNKVREIMNNNDILTFLRGLLDLLEEIEGEIYECVK